MHPGQSAAIYLKGERIGFVGLFILNWNVNWILTVALWCSNGVEQARRPRGASGA